MQIQFNDQTVQCPEGCNISQFLAQLEIRQSGCALAVNQTIIPRAQWPQHLLRDGDQILLFQAIAGG
ncbi:sulfur carrier protein ThiS [Shimwellia blattae]|uniref:Thiamine biosynthesis protein ThiS n=1 Tax=Shimwellia blattae (strain ATCC 29907 / DSM 4481 / JCM 1650 / NBRC 105725 / CDC 9005-74) TaxID=630626 RepID=I2BE09_SHIBC|nr:sulfur carrier protein ThiS [Shimwellia blattae]AFJ48763.1 thiamine biosynthesis protein ThiS [Shimwellia blattae DSM 4481 = NBRC 105725]GAB83076.1 sulfur carrier protein ThiS [Shimwellia blattae DSM 4481 = NBRC 105725]VDY66249.1 Thiamine biosynthesis protein ThiS [Shimwellia blattae]VEC27508.1 Thiamine biosynthesis protein ThiS [Shimwellia blattae]